MKCIVKLVLRDFFREKWWQILLLVSKGCFGRHCVVVTQWIQSQKQVIGYFLLCCLFAKSCPPLCDLMDCSPPGSSVHGISQTRILEWVVISFSRRSSAGRFFTTEPLNIYTHTHTHTHIYITSCLSIHLFVAGRGTSSTAQNWTLV